MDHVNDWIIAKGHSRISFRISHFLVGRITGVITGFDATIYTVNADFRLLSIEFLIDSDSINTGNKSRDKFIKGPSCLDTVNWPKMVFKSAEMSDPDVNDNYLLTGELTIKGIPSKVVFNLIFDGVVSSPMQRERIRFSISGVLRRMDWGIYWGSLQEFYGIRIGKEIRVTSVMELMNDGVADGGSSEDMQRISDD